MMQQMPTPTQGWNNREDLAALAPNEAVKLVNIVPENGYCRTRGGHQVYFSLPQITKPFKTLAVYRSGVDDVLIGCSGGNIVDLSNNTTVRMFKTGMSSDVYDTMMFKQVMVMVNGRDIPQIYGGADETVDINARLTRVNGTDDLGAAIKEDITDKSIANIIGCTSYKGRAFYWLDGEQRFFYADAAGAFQGDLVEFDVSTQMTRGSKIVSMFTYGQDTGGGLSDYLVILFDSGECLMYIGDDPASAQNWEIVQRHQIGRLISPRSVCKVGNDVLLITNEGLVNFSVAISGTTAIDQRHIGSKIVDSYRRNASMHEFKPGWEINYIPEYNFVIANVPRGKSGVRYKQFVYNTSRGAWCKFNDLEAYTWCVFENKLLFSHVNGEVMQAETRSDDNGDFIYCEMIQSFGYHGTPHHKQVTGVGITASEGSCDNIELGMLADFDLTDELDFPVPIDSSPKTALIGEAILGFDYLKFKELPTISPPKIGTAKLGISAFDQKVAKEQPKAQTVTRLPTESYSVGYCQHGETLAMHMKITTKSEIQIYSTKMRYKTNRGKK